MELARRSHYGLLVLATAAVSVSSTLALFAGEGASPLAISFYRLLFATGMLLIPTILYAPRQEFRLSTKEHLWLAGIGLLLAAHFATWVTSLFYTSAASSVVIVTTEALWVPLGAHFLLREQIGRKVWVGVAVAFVGMLTLVSGDLGETRFGPNALIGDILALAAALAASAYFLTGRRFRQKMGLLSYATLVYAWATLFLFLFMVTADIPFTGYSDETLAWMFLFALIPMILGHTVINYILRWMQPHIVSTSILAEPVVSAVLAFVFFTQEPRPLVWVGGALILVGISVAMFGVPGLKQKASAAPPQPRKTERVWPRFVLLKRLLNTTKPITSDFFISRMMRALAFSFVVAALVVSLSIVVISYLWDNWVRHLSFINGAPYQVQIIFVLPTIGLVTLIIAKLAWDASKPGAEQRVRPGATGYHMEPTTHARPKDRGKFDPNPVSLPKQVPTGPTGVEGAPKEAAPAEPAKPAVPKPPAPEGPQPPDQT